MKNYAIRYYSQKTSIKVLLKSKTKCSLKIMLSLALFLVFMSPDFKGTYLKDYASDPPVNGNSEVEHYDLKRTSGFQLVINKNRSLAVKLA